MKPVPHAHPVAKVLVAGCLLWTQAGLAEEPPQENACIEVVVNGVRNVPYDCLTQKLNLPAPGIASARPRAVGSEFVTQMGSNRLMGQFNQAATHQRMGNQFGISVYPQRPAPAVFASPVVGK